MNYGTTRSGSRGPQYTDASVLDDWVLVSLSGSKIPQGATLGIRGSSGINMEDPHHPFPTNLAKQLLWGENFHIPEEPGSRSFKWMNAISKQADELIKRQKCDNELHNLGIISLNAFLQCNITGPPLEWDTASALFPPSISNDAKMLDSVRKRLVSELSVDGQAAYPLIPNVELFSLAKCLLNSQSVLGRNPTPEARWARTSVNFWHQKLLSENASSLQEMIFKDLDHLERTLRTSGQPERARRLIQRASIHIQHGLDVKARDDLREAAKERHFEFALTGRLGKRTKFQQTDLSQLVVLAKSAELEDMVELQGLYAHSNGVTEAKPGPNKKSDIMPQDLDINDDTLLESISFANEEVKITDVPPALASLDPAQQPTLQPLDSIILLAYASSITNTSPSDGLTREETLPYATRVLQGVSTNWQIYTHALLLRSRIEGYRSRTVERSVLQLQALVDQIIAETSGAKSEQTSFLPRPKPSESAPAGKRLQYIHELASPTRWELEAELASRWVSLGGLRTALEIYERLRMWAEVALCWAANDREDKARKIVRQQLYTSKPVEPRDLAYVNFDTEDNDFDVDDLTIEKDPLPTDAPRLFCILGDLKKSPSAYERAWEVSGGRYARAQRSLGNYYFARGELEKADEAYTMSLRVNALNHGAWFTLGCIRLQLEHWSGAVEAFGRAVQIEEKDAESWSNMAAALIQLPPVADGTAAESSNKTISSGEEALNDRESAINPQKHIKDAFVALKRAAAVNRDSYRIWQNLLTVSVKLSPPPYTDIVLAQIRLIELRSSMEGEKSIDIDIMEGLLAHLIAKSPSIESKEQRKPGPGVERMFIDLVQHKITPLITSSRRLWSLVAKLSIYLQKPAAALSAYEKAWRVTLNQSGWESGMQASETLWKDVGGATIELADTYESLGERHSEMSFEEGELVCKDWRFKARSAVRSVLGKAKEGWEGTDVFEQLREKLTELKAP